MRESILQSTVQDSMGKQQYLTLGYYETKQDGLNALAEYHKEPSLFNARSLTLEDIYNIDVRPYLDEDEE